MSSISPSNEKIASIFFDFLNQQEASRLYYNPSDPLKKEKTELRKMVAVAFAINIALEFIKLEITIVGKKTTLSMLRANMLSFLSVVTNKVISVSPYLIPMLVVTNVIERQLLEALIILINEGGELAKFTHVIKLDLLINFGLTTGSALLFCPVVKFKETERAVLEVEVVFSLNKTIDILHVELLARGRLSVLDINDIPTSSANNRHLPVSGVRDGLCCQESTELVTEVLMAAEPPGIPPAFIPQLCFVAGFLLAVLLNIFFN